MDQEQQEENRILQEARNKLINYMNEIELELLQNKISAENIKKVFKGACTTRLNEFDQSGELVSSPQYPGQATPNQGGGSYVTVLGRRRKIIQKGRMKCVMVKGEEMPLSKAKALEKK